MLATFDESMINQQKKTQKQHVSATIITYITHHDVVFKPDGWDIHYHWVITPMPVPPGS